MQAVDESVDNDARRFVCGLMGYFARSEEWPLGAAVNQLAAYKVARLKTEMVEELVSSGWLEIIEEPGLGHRIRRRYVVTERGRLALLPPDPLPSMVPDVPVPYPADPVEFFIYAFHLSFFRRHGRWPNGLERARAFSGVDATAISSARRKAGYDSLVKQGILVNIIFWNGKGEYNCYVMPMYSPEYADKHGVLYFAPLDKTE